MDIWENYLRFNRTVMERIKQSGYDRPDPERMYYDLRYQIIMARIHYLRIQAPIPSDLRGQATYWKQHYNTHLGKGTVRQYIKAYKKYVH